MSRKFLTINPVMSGTFNRGTQRRARRRTAEEVSTKKKTVQTSARNRKIDFGVLINYALVSICCC